MLVSDAPVRPGLPQVRRSDHGVRGCARRQVLGPCPMWMGGPGRLRSDGSSASFAAFPCPASRSQLPRGRCPSPRTGVLPSGFSTCRRPSSCAVGVARRASSLSTAAEWTLAPASRGPRPERCFGCMIANLRTRERNVNPGLLHPVAGGPTQRREKGTSRGFFFGKGEEGFTHRHGATPADSCTTRGRGRNPR